MSRTPSLQERSLRDDSERNRRRTRSAGTFPASSPSTTRAGRGHASRRSDPGTSHTPELLQLPGEAPGYPFSLAPAAPSPTATRRLDPGRRYASPRAPVGEFNAPRPRPIRDVPLYEDGRREAMNTNARGEGGERTPERPRGFLGKLFELLGYAGQDARARRALVSLVFGQLWWFAQFVVVIALLAYSGAHESPTMPGLSEWEACNRPLGTWNALWLIKVVLSSMLSVWSWQRERVQIMNGLRRRNSSSDDDEVATQRVLNGQPHYPRPTHGDTATPRRQDSPRTSGLSYEGTSSNGENGRDAPPPSRLYARVSLFTSFITLAWFLTAHVLEYTSVNSCRLAAPHIWWLTFGLLCTLYLMILEIFLLGLLVFILGPFLYLMYNIVLLCLGRHPLQNPHYIKPDIDKLPKSIVDRIPLVLYIPPPPGESTNTSTPITVPPAAHSYPPKSPTPSSAAVPKRRFAFFRRRKSKDTASASHGGSPDSKARSDKEKDLEAAAALGPDADDEEDIPWDEMWEKGDYPFVRLEGNRAVCAICLMDFEEPKRIRGKKTAAGDDADGEPSSPSAGASAAEATQDIQVEAVTEEERDNLKLTDAGEGAQPLRLLGCGHVFHKTCLDPWLTDVSGRCPICQRPVEIPQPKKKGKRRRDT
ncbi:hypothetical protein L226DRAFT_495504 [Lentinus tigrinus ALCF2SS1-7]|uniref:uncharacterized protein n=1 Tax=Lentinus tigrinus ALCF2SS1-7 TaxID=1328758 RepID=UPI0011663692|nr:hypothetical protein L226DRAFT_495504 [Lentinus tigrinus ALCF2SS1-7]